MWSNRVSFSKGLVFSSVFLGACTPGTPDGNSADQLTEKLMARGRVVYQTNCTACHASDPKKAGSLGPEVFGSSSALLRARILKAAYPEGYTPKRKTSLMVAMPHLEKDIEALEAYLNH